MIKHDSLNLEKSLKLLEDAQAVTPAGVHSPVRAFKAVGGIPPVIDYGSGSYLVDIDGNRYLDFCCSWGPLILGHAHPKVSTAVKSQIDKGMTYGACTELEYQLASFIVEAVEPVERLRFVSSGTEAVMAAIRLARGFTGRDLILKFTGGYHGHSDYLLVEAGSGAATFGQPSSAGVPAALTSETAVLPLDDEVALEMFFNQHGERLAAVIIEGIPANNGFLIQRPEYMMRLRSLTEQYGVLLILDEVITGFRLGLGGAAAEYNLQPDLLTFGKVIGGGMPVGAFGGRAEIMKHLSPDGPVYQAGTLSGNPVAMAAGLATLTTLKNESPYPTLAERTQQFVTTLQSRVKHPDFQVVSRGSIFWLLFQADLPRAAHKIDPAGIQRFNRLHSLMLAAGYYLPPSGFEVGFISSAHQPEDLARAADDLGAIIADELRAA